MKQTRVIGAGLSALLLIFVAPAFAGSINLVNPGFETGDFTGWQTDGNVAVVTAGFCGPNHCASPYAGNYMAVITAGAVSISQLSTDLGVDLASAYPNATYGSAIWQNVNVNAGDSLTFAWNFLGNDYLPFNDGSAMTAFAVVNMVSGVYSLSDISAVGDYGTTGWKVWGPENANFTDQYRIGFVAFNDLDNALSSQLLVDSTVTPEPGTLLLLGSGLAALAGALRRRFC